MIALGTGAVFGPRAAAKPVRHEQTSHSTTGAVSRGTAVGHAQSDPVTVVDFDWEYPRCPEREVSELNRYFFGELDGLNGFHVDDGSGADDVPSSCVLRSDADEAAITSLPDGHAQQPDTLTHYPDRGETIRFDHYVHREGSNMEFRFGVQEDTESYYAVRLETDQRPTLYLLRVDAETPTPLDRIAEPMYTTGEFHRVEIEWGDEIAVTVHQNGAGPTVSARDDAYDQGGIGFFKEETGPFRSYTHFWNNVEAVPL